MIHISYKKCILFVLGVLLLITPKNIGQYIRNVTPPIIKKGALLFKFYEAESALFLAENAFGSMFAPHSYNRAARLIQDADSLFQLDSLYLNVQQKLDSSIVSAKESIKVARYVMDILAPALNARLDAEKTNASKYASDDWDMAELEFSIAANKLENMKQEDGSKHAEKAKSLFRIAERKAITSIFLPQTRKVLKSAEQQKASKLAPISYKAAVELLEKAEQEITKDQRDTEIFRHPALDAYDEAHHVLFLTEKIQQLKNEKASIEKILLSTEALLHLIAYPFQRQLQFDQNYEDIAGELMDYFIDYQDSVQELGANMEISQRLILLQGAYIQLLEKEVETTTEKMKALKNKMDTQYRLYENFPGIIELFINNDAEYFLEGNNLIIRLTSLQFTPGSAELDLRQNTSVEKLIKLINIFPNLKFAIHGHTDSYGNDIANMKLSKQRAEAIKAFLINRLSIDEDRIDTIGYGETKPIASNRTAKGRAKNRRIEFVVYP